MTEIKRESDGFVRISDDVLMKIAETAAREADGVLTVVRRGATGAKRKVPARCTGVAVKNRMVTVTMLVAVSFGSKVHEVCADVQNRVKTAIETMTGLSVAEVNVTVGAIVEQQSKA